MFAFLVFLLNLVRCLFRFVSGLRPRLLQCARSCSSSIFFFRVSSSLFSFRFSLVFVFRLGLLRYHSLSPFSSGFLSFPRFASIAFLFPFLLRTSFCSKCGGRRRGRSGRLLKFFL
ncbi:putative transmembrane protein [Toxoplasma gondii MAS]|uniref:Putative transmembrane protein n=1 Tax=Toxoplasma gondii MAS TaxID=943118 RepID=A0A086QQJ7_TOXGO|nr:putative transmembrane protein [Toxoplasma gondii MAS]